MRIEIKRQGDVELDCSFARELKAYNNGHPGPDVAVFWNSTSVCVDRRDGVWDPRWEVWIEVTDNSHPGNRYIDKSGDTYSEGKRWRFLNTYKYEDGSFAPLDGRFFEGLNWADTWRMRKDNDHYAETVEGLDKRKRETELAMTRDTAYGLASYWRNYGDDVSQFGPGTTGNWRRSGL